MRAILSPDDLRRGELIPPGWYPVEIINYEEKEAGTDQSTNSIFYFKIFDGSCKGTELKRLFNEKALGFGKALWATLGLPKTPDGGYELTTELFEQVGKSKAKLQVYVKRGESNKGNPFNDVADFRPL